MIDYENVRNVNKKDYICYTKNNEYCTRSEKKIFLSYIFSNAETLQIKILFIFYF